MTEPRIVTPEEAQRVEKALLASPYSRSGIDAALLHTVATEPDRTRAAVVKALRQESKRKACKMDATDLELRANAIENGADY